MGNARATSRIDLAQPAGKFCHEQNSSRTQTSAYDQRAGDAEKSRCRADLSVTQISARRHKHLVETFHSAAHVVGRDQLNQSIAQGFADGIDKAEQEHNHQRQDQRTR